MNKYSLKTKLYLARCLIKTKMFYFPARLIRFPFDIRGKQNICWGEGFTTGRNCRLEAFSNSKSDKILRIGNNVQINDYVHISAMKDVKIGNGVLMASKIYISDNTHGDYSGKEYDSHPDSAPMSRQYTCKPVCIEDNVWIGEAVSILPGVTIEKGSIIGANSVVTKNIPPYVIAVGIPAKPIKKFDFEQKKWVKC